ncbi:efflux transporter outer membrane subunit [Herbaspirillum camelliae]|uniref:efflux transporter outer membrane subunit n=1 Tax=Herbaspirillum camelliae TaxID=1892903 RepID=UPI000949C937|nr:efflux transporter outer membrane subunit [Herbaspirillum camelliae]
MKAKIARILVPTLLSASLSGCFGTLAPHYYQPANPIPMQWPGGSGADSSKSELGGDMTWENLVVDQKLRQVIDLALDHNRDLLVATLNIKKARALYQIQRADLLPGLGVDLAGNSGRTPASISTTGSAYTSHAYSVGLGIPSWEIDLFGRLQSLRDQALQQYLSTEALQRGVKIGLIAEVVNSYLTLAADAERMKLAQETERSRQDTYDLQRKLNELGNVSELELRQAQIELEAAHDTVFAQESAVAMSRNALDLLLGTPLPENLKPSSSWDSVFSSKELPPGLPSDLLQRRPDIVAAEHTLVAAHASIGAARAAFFPSISLTGGIGVASNSLSDLFDGGNRTWSFQPQISIPIFSGGRLQGNLDAAKVSREIAVANYDHAIQVAFKEVADALAVRSRIASRMSAQERRVEAAQDAYVLVRRRYNNGVSSYLEVLDAQRTLFTAQQNWISIRLSRQTNTITLYKAMGGDWQQQQYPATSSTLKKATASSFEN